MEATGDQDLLEGLRRGEARAFDAVYEAYRPRLFAFLARLSRRREVAEDLLEETWLRLLAGAGSLRDGTRLGPWLFTVARNLFYDYCRNRLLEAERVGELMRLSREPRPGESPFQALASSELQRRLEQALAALSVSDREVLLLVGVDGLAPAEAALVCGISGEALRQRLSRARARLARLLDRAQDTPRTGGSS